MNLIIVSLAIATFSTTICLSSLFRPIRVLLEPVPVLGKLSRCPYCLNHYLAIPASCIFGVDNLIYTIVNAFAIVAMASIFGYMLLKYLDLLENV
ncbi:hypothetical protein LCGC14_0673700 [marine sediment metagenome]|uniref:Uncharacterized protein n=1 Tax=marine sediment metagenome TaxID=412755 RepID=A0A0F9RAJ8_9ZZZZ